MKNIYAASLLDILPESILLDPKLRASAEALDAQFQAVTAATREVLHLPRLDELSGNIVDYLAEQFHLDFYEPLYLTETEKKNLIRESIAWHRIKGTPAAVEKIAHAAFRDAEILEWFEYDGGEPYHFKIKSHGFKETPDGWATFLRMINTAKNVRSWIDNLEVDYSELIEPAHGFVADAAGWAGIKEISLARPPNIKGKFFAGSSNISFGNKTISLHQPILDGQKTVVHVGQLFEKLGQIIIHADPKDFPPYLYLLESPFAELLLSDKGLVRDGRIAIPVKNYWQRQESYNFAGTGDFVCGLKTLSLPRPPNELSRNFIGQGYSFVGTMSIAPEYTRKRKDYLILRAGLANLRTGYITVDSATTSSIDPNRGYFAQVHKTDPAHVGNGVGWHGVKELSLHVPEFKYLPVVRVGQVLSKNGNIVIDASTSDLPPYVYRLESPLAELLLGDVGFVREGRKTFPVLTYEREFETTNFVGVAQWTHGEKVLGLPEPKDEVAKTFAGLVNKVSGQVKIGTKPTDHTYPIKIHVGQFNLRSGIVTVDSETKSSVDDREKFFSRFYRTDNFAGVGSGIVGKKKITPSTAQKIYDRNLITIRVGQPIVRAGKITINCSDAEEWDDFPVEGDWLRLRFRFPNLGKRFVTLNNPRDDFEKDDVRGVSDTATVDGGILINRDGQGTTGIDLAMLIKRSETKIL